MTIKEVFGEKYGKNVTDKEVNEAFDKMKTAYGTSLRKYLLKGLTEETYKDQIEQINLLSTLLKSC